MYILITGLLNIVLILFITVYYLLNKDKVETFTKFKKMTIDDTICMFSCCNVCFVCESLHSRERVVTDGALCIARGCA